MTTDPVTGQPARAILGWVSDRTILILIIALVVLTFGWVAYDQVFKDRGIQCYVKLNTLFCPPGTTWKYTAAERQWDATKGNYP